MINRQAEDSHKCSANVTMKCRASSKRHKTGVPSTHRPMAMCQCVVCQLEGRKQGLPSSAPEVSAWKEPQTTTQCEWQQISNLRKSLTELILELIDVFGRGRSENNFSCAPVRRQVDFPARLVRSLLACGCAKPQGVANCLATWALIKSSSHAGNLL